MINDQGQIVGNYSKIHLFDVQAGSLVIRESDFTQPGSKIANPIDTPAGRIGLGIVLFVYHLYFDKLSFFVKCYDLRFAEFARLLTVSSGNGAQILTYPSAFTKHTGEAHWEVKSIELNTFSIDFV